MKTDAGIWGRATIKLLGPEGNLKFYEVHDNLITDFGDEYYARMGANVSPPTAVTRMQLGTGTTDPTKTSTIEGFISGSGVVFTGKTVAAVGTNTGWKITYSASWGAGVADNGAITKACITSQTSSTTAAVAGNTISVVEFSAINKGASDTLVINWDHTFYDNPSA